VIRLPAARGSSLAATIIDAATKVPTDEEALALPKDDRQNELLRGALAMPPSQFWSECGALSPREKLAARASERDRGECSGANGGYRLRPRHGLAADVGVGSTPA
jgi:hypothetical protein